MRDVCLFFVLSLLCFPSHTSAAWPLSTRTEAEETFFGRIWRFLKSIFTFETETDNGFLATLSDHILSTITWYKRLGVRPFVPVCGDDADWDLFEPEDRTCQQLSEIFYDRETWWQRTLTRVNPYLPDMKKLRDLPQCLPEVPSLETLKAILPSMASVMYLTSVVPDAAVVRRIVSRVLPEDLWARLRPRISKLIVYNTTTLYLITFIFCLVATVLICWLHQDENDSGDERRVTFSQADDSSDARPGRSGRLAKIRISGASKRSKLRKKNKQRQKTAQSETDEHPSEDECSHESPNERKTVPSISKIDTGVLQYIISGAADQAPDDVKERLRIALEIVANQDLDSSRSSHDSPEQARQSQFGRESPEGVLYDVRRKDTLPPEVMEVLFCIQPNCGHDHSRYELRGCYMLVKPPEHQTRDTTGFPSRKTRPKSAKGVRGGMQKQVPYGQHSESNEKEDSDVEKSAYSRIDVSSTEVHLWGKDDEFVSKYHQTLSGHDLLHSAVTGSSASREAEKEKDIAHRIRGPDALDHEESDSFPDWEAPRLHNDCPYCKDCNKNKSPQHHKGNLNASSGPKSPGQDSSHSGELSSFASAKSHKCSPKRKTVAPLDEDSLGDAIGPPQANSSFQDDPDEVSYDVKGWNDSNSRSRGARRHPGKSPVSTIQAQIPVKSPDGGSREFRLNITGASRENRSHEMDSAPTFDENELNLTSELQDSRLDDTQGSIDVAELNKSLSFYGDVSVPELAASWVVKNAIEKAFHILPGLSFSKQVKDKVLNLSNNILDGVDLVE